MFWVFEIGGTLPAFKYEIVDFFFTRLGTGSTIVVPSVTTYACRYGRRLRIVLAIATTNNVCPAAIVLYAIYIPTNNGEYIKHQAKIP